MSTNHKPLTIQNSKLKYKKLIDEGIYHLGKASE